MPASLSRVRSCALRVAVVLSALSVALTSCNSSKHRSDAAVGAASGSGATAAQTAGGESAGGATAGQNTGGASAGRNAGEATGGRDGGAATSGTPSRPELTAAEADNYTIASYLAKAGDLTTGLVADNWDPTAGVGDVASFTASFTVAATGGTHTSVQAAIDAAVTAGGTERRFIEVRAGTYREVVCVPAAAPPITLYSKAPDPADTVVVFDNYSGKPKAAGSPANPCNPNASATTYGTSGSATFAAYSREFHAKNLTFANDTDETNLTGSLQAVALMTQGDRLIFENVRVLGNQDTLFVKTPSASSVARAYFKSCYVEGDVDFVFGRGTFVLDGCTLHVTRARTPSGVIVAPSTDARNPFGILVVNSMLTTDPGTPAGSMHLGRAWDESQVDLATYATNVAGGVYPNGQATFRNCTIGAHIHPAAPWRAAATTNRPFSSSAATYPANRFYEYDNASAAE